MALAVSLPFRGEALCLHVGRLWLAVRALRRADPPLQETHRTAPLPLPALPASFFALGSPGLAHEASPLSHATTLVLALGPSRGLGMEQEQIHAGGFSFGWTLTWTLNPTNPQKDQGLAHRQTWGSLQLEAPTRPQPQGATQRLLGSGRPNETNLQINELRWTFRHFRQRDRPSESWTLRPAQRWPWTVGGVMG